VSTSGSLNDGAINVGTVPFGFTLRYSGLKFPALTVSTIVSVFSPLQMGNPY